MRGGRACGGRGPWKRVATTVIVANVQSHPALLRSPEAGPGGGVRTFEEVRR